MKVHKSIAIYEARIPFVSLVDKAANQRQFLITKAEGGTAEFKTYGRILKVDEETHYITGVVYEPMKKDAHDNFMTEEEIRKAAYWFAKHGDQVDLQHNFQPADGVSVVETYIAPQDLVFGDEVVAKGSWLLTTEVENTVIWKAVQDKEITGYSMGGIGKYSEEDVDLSKVSKEAPAAAVEPQEQEKMGVLAKVAGWLGINKGIMADTYQESMKYSGFWNAFDNLQDILLRYVWVNDSFEFESNESTIREALAEFAAIITDLLTQQSITKALAGSHPLCGAGEELRKSYADTYTAFSQVRKTAAGGQPVEEEIQVTNQELQEMIESAIQKHVEPLMKALEEQPAAPPAAEPPAEQPTTEPPAEPVQQQEAPAAEPLTAEQVAEIVEKTLDKKLEPLYKSRGVPSNLNDSGAAVAKQETHFLAGIL